mmetsp:Transcript_22492/g.49159  ORF Transcript_22492/g.49159 Transcript_22492/m.49159 type:complete len:106 (-) Transcript_22492:851-1168(-)
MSWKSCFPKAHNALRTSSVLGAQTLIRTHDSSLIQSYASKLFNLFVTNGHVTQLSLCLTLHLLLCLLIRLSVERRDEPVPPPQHKHQRTHKHSHSHVVRVRMAKA